MAPEEVEKLDGWGDDLKVGLEREIKNLDRQIREARHSARSALTLEDKLAVQKRIKALEALLQQRAQPTMLFRIRWRLI